MEQACQFLQRNVCQMGKRGYIQRHLRLVALLVPLLVGVAVLVGCLICVVFVFGVVALVVRGVVLIGRKHGLLDVSLAIRTRKK